MTAGTRRELPLLVRTQTGVRSISHRRRYHSTKPTRPTDRHVDPSWPRWLNRSVSPDRTSTAPAASVGHRFLLIKALDRLDRAWSDRFEAWDGDQPARGPGDRDGNQNNRRIRGQCRVDRGGPGADLVQAGLLPTPCLTDAAVPDFDPVSGGSFVGARKGGPDADGLWLG